MSSIFLWLFCYFWYPVFCSCFVLFCCEMKQHDHKNCKWMELNVCQRQLTIVLIQKNWKRTKNYHQCRQHHHHHHVTESLFGADSAFNLFAIKRVPHEYNTASHWQTNSFYSVKTTEILISVFDDHFLCGGRHGSLGVVVEVGRVGWGAHTWHTHQCSQGTNFL